MAAVAGRAWPLGSIEAEVLVADQGAVYERLKASMNAELGSHPGLKLRWVDRVGSLAGASLPRCVVTLGVRSLQLAVARSKEFPAWSQVPVLAALIPQLAYRSLAEQMPKGSSAVWLDQPVERYMGLLRAAMPLRHRVGVLIGPGSQAQEGKLEAAASARGLQLVQSNISTPTQDIFPNLQFVLGACDVFLVLPDPVLYTASSLQNILIASYRQRVPLLSYAAAHTSAGATLALHTPVETVATQVLAALRTLSVQQGLPPPEGPRDLAVSVNDQVARSLGLNLPAAAGLEVALRRLENRS